jgi:hypothetical protein
MDPAMLTTKVNLVEPKTTPRTQQSDLGQSENQTIQQNEESK